LTWAGPPVNDDKVAGASESFRPFARELGRLDEKDPILAAQAARLVALYRRLWESYVAKNAERQRLDKENQQLKNTNASLSEEKRQAEGRSLEYDVLLSYYKEAHQKIEEGIIGVLQDWNGPLVDSADAGKQRQDGSEYNRIDGQLCEGRHGCSVFPVALDLQHMA
jgi:hypothetical protein